MRIETFIDKGLAHNSYLIESKGEAVLIDPARDPKPYFDFAESIDASIIAVVETHPHADFISSHSEINKTSGATIYVSKLVGAKYPHTTFDDGDAFQCGELIFRAMNTPGHSPDSISVTIEKDGKTEAVFTGDTLFVGDVGRPDLREGVGNIQATKEELAEQMYDSTRNKLMKLQEQVIVYPAHGAGSLCGKNISADLCSTIGRELKENYALKELSKKEFVDILVQEQPLIPKYFPYDVDMNRAGAPDFLASLNLVKIIDKPVVIDSALVVVDVRDQLAYKAKHITGAINIMDSEKFETWLGAIVSPEERIAMIVESKDKVDYFLRKAAKIGYEQLIEFVAIASEELFEINPTEKIDVLDYDYFANHQDEYFILDIRNKGEVETAKFFKDSFNIPLAELRERVNEIKTDKKIIVHCAAGVRSAAGASIVQKYRPEIKVFDLSTNVEKHK